MHTCALHGMCVLVLVHCIVLTGVLIAGVIGVGYCNVLCGYVWYILYSPGFSGPIFSRIANGSEFPKNIFGD